MAIRVALNHKTSYTYDRPVALSPQLVRLRPAPHCRTPVLSYSLRALPKEHFENWQQDPHGNFLARLVFPDKVTSFEVEIDLIAELKVINPFDFFLESYAENFPFTYEDWLARDLRPFLELVRSGPLVEQYLEEIDRRPQNTVDFLVDINQRLQNDIRYLIRMEPGVQTPEETLAKRCGSCRDTAWLLVQILRRLGLAARFVSGYLIQLTPDVKPLEGPAGAAQDFTDLHAWTEVYLPGAGWIGLDPTSGLFAGEGHLPLACTPDTVTAAPISGAVQECESTFDFQMTLQRIYEDPRVTRPYSDEQWNAIVAVGREVDARLKAGDVRLTMGGEPTFVSIDDMEGAEWTVSAVGPTKRQLSEVLVRRLQQRFAPGSLLHYGQGKWYPGESLPRWALSCLWRIDGEPIWKDPEMLADARHVQHHSLDHAERFVNELAERLEVGQRWVIPAYEDVLHYITKERRLPLNVDARDSKLKDPEERARLAQVMENGIGQAVGYVLPLRRQWWQSRPQWTSGAWPVRSDRLFLLPGDSPIGLRLPLDSLPWSASSYPTFFERDPMEPREPLASRVARQSRTPQPARAATPRMQRQQQQRIVDASAGVVRTALCIEPRDGQLHIFMPPVERIEDYLELVEQIEETAHQLAMPVVIEGYLPPIDHRLRIIKVTPDPGVIEVNIHPAYDWQELVDNTVGLYEEARLARLGTEKFDLDGRHTGTGGGNHVVLGGPTPADSPFLRRPDLLKSFLGYWNNHPGLSYLFSGTFVGPTSQAPRVDEGRRDALYELQLAFQQVPAARDSHQHHPWLVDRLFRNLLVDLTGNTHRAEFCIDKLFSPDTASGRLGLVEFRAFEMPPHAQMSVTQQLLLRALAARFWEQPYEAKLVDWNTTLHDRFLLPHFVWQDFAEVIDDVCQHGFEMNVDWFAPHYEFRFPRIGSTTAAGVGLELRQAIEPWYVLGEEPGAGGTTRYVDSSVERLQVLVTGCTDERHLVTCNGRRVPLQPTGRQGEFVAAVRYRAWQPPSCLHPTIPVHTPLIFDIVDTWNHRSVGGCTYHVAHPAGRNFVTFPVNAYEAESRRAARFFHHGHTGGKMTIAVEQPHFHLPLTLDLRREAARS